jgi:hypothetical protein
MQSDPIAAIDLERHVVKENPGRRDFEARAVQAGGSNLSWFPARSLTATPAALPTMSLVPGGGTAGTAGVVIKHSRFRSVKRSIPRVFLLQLVDLF